MTLPSKPRKDFPLSPHASGKWVKKINGRHYYFGRWDDPAGAEREYDRVKSDLLAGYEAVPSTQSLTIRFLLNEYLATKLAKVERGELSQKSYFDIRGTLQHFAGIIGAETLVDEIGPRSFGLARSNTKHLGPHATTRYIVIVKGAFRYALNNGIITKPVIFGDDFKPPTLAARRRYARRRAEVHGVKLFTTDELKSIIHASKEPVKTMVLLGINCAMLAADLSELKLVHIDLKNAWISFPRVKTEVERECSLWPETVESIKATIELLKKRRKGDLKDYLFVTKYGRKVLHQHVKTNDEGKQSLVHVDSVGQEFTKAMKRAGVKKSFVGFSALRTTFSTIADEFGDGNAKMTVMGHALKGMDVFYVRSIGRERVKKLSDAVRAKLFAS